MTEAVRVLVVDDAAFMRRTLVKLLRQDPNVVVVGEARNGREAIDLFNATRPDVICLDVDMPEMDGMTALKHFMSTRPTPIVVVSSMTDRENVPFELFRLGAIDFFPKPSSLVGAVEDQTRLLLYLIRNARNVQVDNLLRVPLYPTCVSGVVSDGLRHLLVIGGALGSVGALIRFLALLPPRTHDGVGMLCMVPLQDAIGASFQNSLSALFGWETRWLDESLTLRGGQVCLVNPRSRIRISGRTNLELQGETEHALDELFSAVGAELGSEATVILLAGSEPHGVAGLSSAASAGSHCFVQDPKTALFSTWQPEVPEGVVLLDLESVAATVLGCLSRSAAGSAHEETR